MVKRIDQLNTQGQKVRARLFKPLFVLLTKLRITPNMITAARLITIPIYLYYIVRHPALAITAIIIGSATDMIDGGLARHQGIASDRGKFWDVLVDHLLFVFGIFGIFFIGTASPIYLGYSLVLIPILFLLATIATSENTKTDWIIHPYYRIVFIKPFGIASLISYGYFQYDFFQEMIILVNIAITILTIYYVIVLAKRWSK